MFTVDASVEVPANSWSGIHRANLRGCLCRLICMLMSSFDFSLYVRRHVKENISVDF